MSSRFARFISSFSTALFVFLAAGARAKVVTPNLRLPDEWLRGDMGRRRGHGCWWLGDLKPWQFLGLGIFRVKRRPPFHFSYGIGNQLVPIAMSRFLGKQIALNALQVGNGGIDQTVGIRLAHVL